MKQNSIFEKVSARDPDPQMVAAAADLLKTGGLLIFPTTGLYGLGADALNPASVKKIFKIKQRDLSKPILVLVKDASELGRIAEKVPGAASALMNAFWPGALTIILEAHIELPDVLTGGTGKIGIRVPKHPVASALVNAFDGPITGTSANLSGQAGCSYVADLDPGVVQRVDIVLDAGPLKGGVGSTVVDATSDPPLVLREGAVSKQQLESVL
ncbi:MAG: L-threonylcarbamoyladenylate synthase [Thermodesulfobacteriota bacterium]